MEYFSPDALFLAETVSFFNPKRVFRPHKRFEEEAIRPFCRSKNQKTYIDFGYHRADGRINTVFEPAGQGENKSVILFNQAQHDDSTS
jgi:hypothetical protein